MLTLLVETIDSSDGSGFVISSENAHFSRVFYFERKQQTNCFDSLSPSINVVTQEQIAGFRRKASILEESQHVIILSMNVATDLYWCAYFQQHRLLHEDNFDSSNESEDVLF